VKQYRQVLEAEATDAEHAVLDAKEKAYDREYEHKIALEAAAWGASENKKAERYRQCELRNSPAAVDGRRDVAVGAMLCALLCALIMLAASAVPDAVTVFFTLATGRILQQQPEALMHALASRSPPPLASSFAMIRSVAASFIASFLYVLYRFWSLGGFRIPLRILGAVGRGARWLGCAAITTIIGAGGAGQMAVHMFGYLAIAWMVTLLVTQGEAAVGGASTGVKTYRASPMADNLLSFTASRAPAIQGGRALYRQLP